MLIDTQAERGDILGGDRDVNTVTEVFWLCELVYLFVVGRYL